MMRPTMYLRECVRQLSSGAKVEKWLQQRWESADGKQHEWRDVDQHVVAVPKMKARANG